MFFIINASDLAQDEVELTLVQDYIQEQLEQLEIRFPKIFPISSQYSLNKDPNNKQMVTLKTAFNNFMERELSALTMKSALWDLKRVSQLLQQYRITTTMREENHLKYWEELQQKAQNLKVLVKEAKTKHYKDQLLERIHRQLHYVGERVIIRFHDIFRQSFHPTNISSGNRRELEICLHLLIDSLGYELLQEIRAVSLRVEATIYQLIEQFYKDLQEQLLSVDEQFLLKMFERSNLETPEYTQAF